MSRRAAATAGVGATPYYFRAAWRLRGVYGWLDQAVLGGGGTAGAGDAPLLRLRKIPLAAAARSCPHCRSQAVEWLPAGPARLWGWWWS